MATRCQTLKPVANKESNIRATVSDGKEGFEVDADEPSGFATGEIDANGVEMATESFFTPGEDRVKDTKLTEGTV